MAGSIFSLPRAGLDPEIVTQAAAVIVDADGAAALTLVRLAADLGVAPPSLYKHVAGIDDVMLRVTLLSITRLADTLTLAALGQTQRKALFAVAGAYRGFAKEHAGLYALTQAVAPDDPPARQAESARAVGVLAAVVRSYSVLEPLSIPAIRMVRAGLHGFADIEMRGGFQMPEPVDQSFLVLVDALDQSLRTLALQRPASP